MKHVIFDFDGVFVANSDYLAGFLSQIIPFCSLEKAERIIVKAGKHNATYSGMKGRLRKYGSSLFYSYLVDFLKDKHKDYELQIKNDLLFLIEKLDIDAYLLTSNYRSIIDLCIEDRTKLFTDIITFDDVANKTKGIEQLVKTHNLDLKDCVFITDTTGDIQEFSQLVEKSNILAVDWGFHSRELLEEYIPSNQIFSTVLSIEKFLTKA